MWVQLVGKATVFLTLCIQSAVNELIRVSRGSDEPGGGRGGRGLMSRGGGGVGV